MKQRREPDDPALQAERDVCLTCPLAVCIEPETRDDWTSPRRSQKTTCPWRSGGWVNMEYWRKSYMTHRAAPGQPAERDERLIAAPSWYLTGTF